LESRGAGDGSRGLYDEGIVEPKPFGFETIDVLTAKGIELYGKTPLPKPPQKTMTPIEVRDYVNSRNNWTDENKRTVWGMYVAYINSLMWKGHMADACAASKRRSCPICIIVE